MTEGLVKTFLEMEGGAGGWVVRFRLGGVC
jgi:hypothetical protein